MRLLRILCFGRVLPRRFGKIILPVTRHDDFAQLVERLTGYGDRVRTHVCDQPNRSIADVNTLVEALGNHHRFLCTEAELTRSFLLQRRSRKWRRRVTPTLSFLDVCDVEKAVRGRSNGFLGFAHGRFIREAKLLDLFSVEGEKPCRYLVLAVLGERADGPVFLRFERGDLVLSLDDEAQRRALHATCGETAPDLLPQQR